MSRPASRTGRNANGIGVAVVGCGYWGPNLVRNFNSLQQCGNLICCDTDISKLNRVKALYPHVSTTTSIEALLRRDDIRAVAIATPVRTHYELAKACLLAGKDVLIEKPLAASSDECRSLISLAEARQRILMVGHTFEYAPAVNKVREVIRSRELGEILYLSFTRVNLGLFQPDINVMWDLAAHDISILIYLLEKQPLAVNAVGRAHFRDHIHDVATASLHFDNGEIAFLHTSWLDPCKIRRLTVVGTSKMLVYDDVEVYEKVRIYDKRVEAPRPYDTFADFHFSYRYGDILIPRIEDQEPLKLECQHFLECVETRAAPRTDGHSGARVVNILEAISESITRSGALVELPRAEPSLAAKSTPGGRRAARARAPSSSV